MGIDRAKVYFRLPQNEVVVELKERVPADCAKMKGWRSRQGASCNVNVHSAVVLYSVKVRHRYIFQNGTYSESVM